MKSAFHDDRTPDSRRVSVVLPFLNAERFLEEAIRSVLQQTYEGWELFLVDDGSRDSGTDIARRYASNDLRIRYLQHDNGANRGISASRNLGLRNAKGEYVTFLDSDDIYLPEKLAHQISILDQRPEVGMVYGRSLYWHSWSGSPEAESLDRVQPHGFPGDTVVDPPGSLAALLTGRAATPCPSSVMVRRAVAWEVGLFEESFPGMYEDQAFYAKVFSRYPVFASEACLDRYRQHDDSICATTDRQGQLLTERRRFLNWLANHLESAGEQDRDVCQALCRELWLTRDIRGLGSRSRARVRWFDKWRLRLESSVLTGRAQSRLWAQRWRRLGRSALPPNDPAAASRDGS